MERKPPKLLNRAGLLIGSILGLNAGGAMPPARSQTAAPPRRGRGRARGSKLQPFRHPARTLDVLVGCALMAGPADRYLESPALAAKRKRQLWRAVKRGRAAQIEQKLSAYTGQPLYTRPAA